MQIASDCLALSFDTFILPLDLCLGIVHEIEWRYFRNHRHFIMGQYLARKCRNLFKNSIYSENLKNNAIFIKSMGSLMNFHVICLWRKCVCFLYWRAPLAKRQNFCSTIFVGLYYTKLFNKIGAQLFNTYEIDTETRFRCMMHSYGSVYFCCPVPIRLYYI